MTPGNPVPSAEQPASNHDPGRDSRGRFSKGNKGGPGNPFARQTARMRQVLLDCVSEDDLHAIVTGLVEDAKNGDLGAARLVLSYVVGKPTAAVDPDHLDVEEFDLFQQEAKSSEQVLTPINGVPAGLAC